MRLRTIGLINTLALGLLAAPSPAKAQQAGKVYRIGFLCICIGSGSPLTSFVAIAFRQGLRASPSSKCPQLLDHSGGRVWSYAKTGALDSDDS